MSPRVFKQGAFVFWFHSYDALSENRASIHVGKGSQNDAGDPKIWLESEIAVERTGHTLDDKELNHALKIIKKNHARLLEAWSAHKKRAGEFGARGVV